MFFFLDLTCKFGNKLVRNCAKSLKRNTARNDWWPSSIGGACNVKTISKQKQMKRVRFELEGNSSCKLKQSNKKCMLLLACKLRNTNVARVRHSCWFVLLRNLSVATCSRLCYYSIASSVIVVVVVVVGVVCLLVVFNEVPLNWLILPLESDERHKHSLDSSKQHTHKIESVYVISNCNSNTRFAQLQHLPLQLFLRFFLVLIEDKHDFCANIARSLFAIVGCAMRTEYKLANCTIV